MFDMRKCKPGDKLISKHGKILEYVEHQPNEYYSHIVKYPNGSLGSRTDTGLQAYQQLPEDEDIVGFYNED